MTSFLPSLLEGRPWRCSCRELNSPREHQETENRTTAGWGRGGHLLEPPIGGVALLGKAATVRGSRCLFLGSLGWRHPAGRWETELESSHTPWWAGLGARGKGTQRGRRVGSSALEPGMCPLSVGRVDPCRPQRLARYCRSLGKEGFRETKKARTSSLEAEEGLSLCDKGRWTEVSRWQARLFGPRQVTLCLICKAAVILFPIFFRSLSV